MKISNSKKELARIISENGGWRERAGFAAQDQNATVTFFVDAPWRCETSWEASEFEAVDGFGVKDMALKNWHQSILSRDEYFHLYPAPDADGWIEWMGGECPVGGDVMVVCKVRTGKEFRGGKKIKASILRWRHTGGMADIIAYRLHKPEQALSELCDKVAEENRHEQVWANPPTIEQLASDYRSAKDYAERKQKEADDAKADADAKLKALELAGAALGLLVSPITAKKEPELVIADWRDLRVGDLVVITGSGNDAWSAFEGKELSVARTGRSENELMFTSEDGDEWYASGNTQWNFICRP